MLVPHTNSSLIQIAGARQLGNTLVQGTWMEQTRQLGNAMAMLVQTEPGQIHMNQINQLGNELVQSANDLVERYQGVDMASLAQVIRTRVMVQLDRYLDLLDGFQGTVAWLLEQCDHYPFISFILAYAFFLAFISMSPHFILSPRIPLGATRKKDKNVDEMGGGFRHGLTVTAHTELIQRAFFPALETHVSVSDLLFSSRLFIPLLWTWTARHPVPYVTLPATTPAIPPRLRPALLGSTLFINTNYRRESAPEAEAEAEPELELEPEVVAEAEAGSEPEPEPIQQEDTTNNPVVFRTPAAVGNSNTLWPSPLRVPDQTRLSLPISGDKSSNVVFNSSPSQKGNGKKKRRGGISNSSIDKASKNSSSHSSTGSFSNILDMFRKRRSAPAVMDKYSSSSAANIGKKKRSRLSSWLDVLPAVSKKQKRKSSQLSSEVSSTSQSNTTYSRGASEVHDEFEVTLPSTPFSSFPVTDIPPQRQLYRETSACTTCNITVSQNMLDADFVSDAYDPSRIPAYIPLTTAPKHEDESIDPCHVPGRSPSKHEDGGRGQSVSVQQGFLAAEQPLSVYAFHRHVHEHRQYRRSFLTMCRSEDEVKRWQGWAGRMERGKDEVESVNRRNVKAIEEKDDRNAILETPPPDGYMDTGLLIELGDENENENKNVDKQAWFARSTACELKNQVRLWWTQANSREQRLRESRAVWEQLKKQREKERQQLLWERRKEMIRHACSKERVKKRIEAMRAKRAEWKKREPERRVKRARERNAAKREERKKMTWKTRPPSVHSIPPDERWMV